MTPQKHRGPQRHRESTRNARFCVSVAFFLCFCGVVSSADAALELSTDHRSLSFGMMDAGEEKTLAQSGSHHTEVTCLSTNGQTWYLKISLLRPMTAGGQEIPAEYFGWQVTQSDGTGNTVSSNEFRPFSMVPELVYISGSGEGNGQPVRLRFRYMLKVPEAQVNGFYQAAVRFTLTEVN